MKRQLKAKQSKPLFFHAFWDFGIFCLHNMSSSSSGKKTSKILKLFLLLHFIYLLFIFKGFFLKMSLLSHSEPEMFTTVLACKFFFSSVLFLSIYWRFPFEVELKSASWSGCYWDTPNELVSEACMLPTKLDWLPQWCHRDVGRVYAGT